MMPSQADSQSRDPAPVPVIMRQATKATDVANTYRDPTSNQAESASTSVKPGPRVLTKECLAAQPPPPKDPVDFTHLINPFNSDDPHFNFTLRSIAAAVRRARETGIIVEVLGIHTAGENLDLPSEITPLPIITRDSGSTLRSTGFLFGDGEKPLATPLVQDVFMAGFDHASSGTIIWTNFDLILHPDFYVVVHRELTTGLKGGATPKIGFSVLRLDVMIERNTHPSLANWNVADVYNVADTRGQGGHDCLVFPRRWIPCLDSQRMMFGVGGWGFSFFAQMVFLAELEGTVRFSMLKPGVHTPAVGITRHIGSQVANPARWYSNPVRWLGPMRRNQLTLNMRLKTEVDIKLALIKRPERVCERHYFGSASPQMQLITCPTKKSGAQQPIAAVIPSPASAKWMHGVIGQLTGLEAGTMHNPKVKSTELGEKVVMMMHSTGLLTQPLPVDPLESIVVAGMSGPEDELKRYGPGAWDAVVVLVEPQPVRSIIAWLQQRHGRKAAEALLQAGVIDGTVQPKLVSLCHLCAGPERDHEHPLWSGVQGVLVQHFIDVYDFWIKRYHSGGGVVQIVNPYSDGNMNVGASELMRLAELLQITKLGHNNRYCQRAPVMNICRGLNATALIEMTSPVVPENVRHWIEEQIAPVMARLTLAWSESQVTETPEAGPCCGLQGKSTETAIATLPSTLAVLPLSRLVPPISAVETIRKLSTPLEFSKTKRVATPLFSRNTRRARVTGAMPSLFSIVPTPDVGFDPLIKNPCWHNSTRLRCVPAFFLLGQVKCGTTDVFSRLSLHPKIVQATVKEQHMFSREWYDGERYISQFDRAGKVIGSDKIVGDGTPDYIWAHLRCLNKRKKYPHDRGEATIAEVLAELNPKARLVLMLREPTSRLWSDFFYFAHRPERDIKLPPESDITAQHFDEYVSDGLSKIYACVDSQTTLRECVWSARTSVYGGATRIIMGCYGFFIEEYLAHFDRSQLIIHTLEEYHANQTSTILSIFDHLDVSPPTTEVLSRISAQKSAANQQNGRYRKLKMLNKTASALHKFYSECNTYAYELLGDPRFKAWNEKKL